MYIDICTHVYMCMYACVGAGGINAQKQQVILQIPFFDDLIGHTNRARLPSTETEQQVESTDDDRGDYV